MPFKSIRVRDGEVVYPDEATDEEETVCLECGEQMKIVGRHHHPHVGVKPRHFSHHSDTDCPGGEKDPHKLMKYIASRHFLNNYPTATVEREAGVPETQRRADVLVTFADNHDTLGRGVIAEAQHENHSKDVEAVAEEYLEAGFSVYVLDESHFSDEWTTVEPPKPITVWPNAVPEVSDHSPAEHYIHEVREMAGGTSECKINFPAEVARSNKKAIRAAWRAGKGDFDLAYRLERNNAPRRCGICGNDAKYYLFLTGGLSAFRCLNHLPGGREGLD